MTNQTKTILLSFVFAVLSCKQHEPVQVATIAERIFDEANLLTDQEEKTLFDEIFQLQEDIGPDIAVMTIDSLGNQTIEEFALTKINEMQLGRKNLKDGLLIVVAFNEAKIRIEVGYGLERIVKDEVAADIIARDMAPKFEKEEFFSGLYAAIIRIRDLIEKNEDLVGRPRERF